MAQVLPAAYHSNDTGNLMHFTAHHVLTISSPSAHHPFIGLAHHHQQMLCDSLALSNVDLIIMHGCDVAVMP